MAAGVTVAPGGLDAFAAFMNARLEAAVAAASDKRPLRLDLSVAPAGLTMALADALRAIEPCGQGWPRPRVAVGPLCILKASRIGKEAPGDHVRVLATGQDGGRVAGVAFRAGDTPLGQMLLAAGDQPLWLAGRVAVNEWQGRTTAELHLDDAGLA